MMITSFKLRNGKHPQKKILGTKLMKKIMSFGLAAAFIAVSIMSAQAMVRYEDKYPKKIREVRITGFIDYAPFGYTQHPDSKMRGKFFSVYQPMIDTFQKENNLKIIYNLKKNDYEDLVAAVRSGDIDMTLGMYHETELYKGLEAVYPSIMSNPITVFMLPNRINEVQKIEDLKKLKGVGITKEHYSDYVAEQIKQYNLEMVDTPYELFERLFTKKADYIMVSQYYGLVEAIKLGLREQISIAKQTLWKMPLFIGVSKISPQRKLITQKLTRFSEDPKNQQLIEDYLKQMIADFEKEYNGVVPPTFGLEKDAPQKNDEQK